MRITVIALFFLLNTLFAPLATASSCGRFFSMVSGLFSSSPEPLTARTLGEAWKEALWNPRKPPRYFNNSAVTQVLEDKDTAELAKRWLVLSEAESKRVRNNPSAERLDNGFTLQGHFLDVSYKFLVIIGDIRLKNGEMLKNEAWEKTGNAKAALELLEDYKTKSYFPFFGDKTDYAMTFVERMDELLAAFEEGNISSLSGVDKLERFLNDFTHLDEGLMLDTLGDADKFVKSEFF